MLSFSLEGVKGWPREGENGNIDSGKKHVPIPNVLCMDKPAKVTLFPMEHTRRKKEKLPVAFFVKSVENLSVAEWAASSTTSVLQKKGF
jgi:hypothetical protein